MDAVETSDGGFLLLGATSSYGSGGTDISVIRTDSIGRQIWAKTYGGSSDETIANAFGGTTVWAGLLGMPDSGFVICSNTKSYGAGGADVYLIRADKNGNVLWTRTYGGTSDDEGLKVQAAFDGGFIIVGETRSYGAGSADAFVIKTDDSGKVVWDKTFGGSAEDVVFDVEKSRDSVYYIAGYTYSFGTTKGDFYILKLRKNGTLIWSRAYGGSDWDIGFDIVELPDRSLYVCGQTQTNTIGSVGGVDNDFHILKLDSAGSLKWGKNFGGTSREGGRYIFYENGFLHWSGWSGSFGAGSGALTYAKLDTSGAVKLLRSYSPTAVSSYMMRLKDKRLFFTGGTNSFGNGSYDMYFLKTDSTGATDACNSVTGTPTVKNNKMGIIAPTTLSANPSLTVKSGVSVKTVSIKDYLKCEPFVPHFTWSHGCAGELTQFYDSTYTSSKGDVRTWKTSDGYTLSGSTPTHIFSSAGTYDVKLIVKRGSKTDSVTYAVTVQSKPTVKILKSDTTICFGDSIHLSALTSGVSYQWSPGVYFNDSTSATPWIKPSGNLNVILKVANSYGCVNYDTMSIKIDTSASCSSLNKIGGVINKYSHVISIDTCLNNATLDTTSFFKKGDLALLIQMQGVEADTSNTSNFGDIKKYNNAGNYEYVTIDSVNSTKVFFKYDLKHGYDAAGSVQLITVPQYTNLLVTKKLIARTWDNVNKKGGVLIFKASGLVSLYNDIDVTGRGFNGGKPSYQTTTFNCNKDFNGYFYTSQATLSESGDKGQGVIILKARMGAGMGKAVNGGGGGNQVNAGGGGGGNGGAGGNGGKTFSCTTGIGNGLVRGGIGGAKLTYSISDERIFMGGGGGGGQQNDNKGIAGTNGGGIVIIDAQKLVTNSKNITANGPDNVTADGDGGGGGGAGGTVLLNVDLFEGTLNIEAKGGKGSYQTNNGNPQCHGTGGGGGGGMVLFKTSIPSANINVKGGVAGVSTSSAAACSNTTYGADSGRSGSKLANFGIPQGDISSSLASGKITTTTKQVCKGDSVMLTASGGVKYRWFIGTTALKAVDSPYAVINAKTTYKVFIYNSKGCSISDSITIDLRPSPDLKPVVPRCISIVNDSTITFSWLSKFGVDTSYFGEYQIFRRPGGLSTAKPFQLLTTIKGNWKLSSYTDQTAYHADTGSYGYMVVAVNSCGKDNLSNSISIASIVLKARRVSDRRVKLLWNHVSFSKFYDREYVVEADTGTGFYKLFSFDDLRIGSGTSTIVYDCRLTARFRVSGRDTAKTCKSYSNATHEFMKLRDNTAPNAPTIKQVTVDNLGKITVTFLKSDSNDVDFYTIFRSENGGFYSAIKIIDVLSPDPVYTYADTPIVTATKNYCYKIQATDSCGNTAMSGTHCAVNLSVNVGDLKHTLTWNPYSGFTAINYVKVERWNPVVKKWDSIGSTSGTVNSYVDTLVRCHNFYSYRVTTYEKNGLKGVSRSDSVKVQAFDTIAPKKLQIKGASVTGKNEITLSWSPTTDNDIDSFRVYASVNGGAYKKIGGNAILIGKTDYTFVHSGIDPQKDSYCYYILLKDSCAGKSTPSDTHCVVQLSATAGNKLAKLKWSKYQGFEVSKYEVQQLKGSSWNTVATTLNDTITIQPLGCKTWVAFRIKTTEKNGNSFESISDTAWVRPYDTVRPQEVNIRYANVISNSSIQLVMDAVPDKDVDRYEIYVSKNGSPFNLLITLFKPAGSVITYTHNNVTPTKDKYCYQVKAVDSCADNRSLTSETHCASILSGTAGNYENNVRWTKYVGFNVKYYILQRFDGIKTRKDTLSPTDTSFRDTAINCNQNVQYFLYAQDKDNATFGSNANTITLTPFDTVKPAQPVMNNVIVVGKSIIVSWQKSVSSDVKDYNIYRQVSGSSSWTKIGSVRNVLTYTDLTADPDANSYCYRIEAVDSCAKNVSVPSVEHCTVQLKAGIVGCERHIDLQWNAYSGWTGVNKYEIYRSVDGGSESLLTTITPPTTSYSDTGLDFRKTFTYRIKAYQKGGSQVSWSNDTLQRTYFVATPVIKYASKTTTSATAGQVVVRWQSQATLPHMKYHRFYFATSASGPFSQIGGSIPVSKDSFVLNGLNTRNGEYYFYMETVDSCGNVSDESSHHKTIDLDVQIGQLIHDIKWTPYEGFTVKGYYLQRLDGGHFENIDTLPPTDTFNRQFPAPCNFNIFYRIAAFNAAGDIAYSDTMGRTAIDTVFANPAKIQNVTVIDGNSAQVLFRGSDSLDVYAYTIQRAKNGQWGTAGQVLFSSADANHSFTDNTNTSRDQLCYTVLTLDSCLNVSYSDTFCAIQLKGQAVNLGNIPAWHPFVGYPIKEYALLKLTGSTWDTLTKTTDTSFIHSPLPCNVPVIYRVAGSEDGGSRITLSDTAVLVPWDTIRPPRPVTYYSSVIDGKSIELHWEKSAASDVKVYEVSIKSDHSAWKAYDTVQALSYTFTGLKTTDSTYSFRIRAIDSCAENASNYGIVHTPVQLTGKPLNLANQLDWSAYKGFGAIKKQYVYWLDKGIWQLLDSTDASTFTYTHTPLSCNVPRYYKIKTVESANGYFSWSDSIKLTPFDTIKPPQPVTYYATVASGSTIDLFWEKSLANDVKLYEVSIKSAKSAWKVEAKVNVLSYHFTGLNTTDSTYSFRIRAIDSCAANTSVYGITHTVAQLRGTPKNLSNQLDWSAYEGFAAIGEHYIYQYVGGNWKLIDSTDAGTTTYTHKPLPCNVPQFYKIKTKNAAGNFVSWSDSVMVTPFDTIKPDAPALNFVTVNADGSTTLSWHWDTTSEVKYFEIWRKYNYTPFAKLTTVVYDSVYIDKGIDAGTDMYSYYIIAIDSCNMANRSPRSDTDNVVNLYLTTGGCKPFVKLEWLPYHELPKKVDGYIIYRSTNGGAFTPVNAVPANVTTWVDSAVDDVTQYFYRIQALDTESKYTSFSDTIGVKPWTFPVPQPAQMVYTTVERTGKTNGAIRVEWTPYTVPGDTFARGYNIYHRQNGGQYKLLYRQTGFATNWLIHSGINTEDSSHEYYVTVYNVCEIEGKPSTSHSPVNLDVTNENLAASVSWNSYKGDTVSSYELVRIHNSATPRVIKTFSSTDTAYRDSGLLCDHDYVYIVRSLLKNGSTSISDSVHIVARDTIPSPQPDLLYISVDTTDAAVGKISMRFNGNAEPNRSGYRIYRSVNGAPLTYYTTLFTAKTGTIFWENAGLNTKDNRYSYYLVAIDSCNNFSTPSDTHTQVFLTVKAQSLYNKLTWTDYIGYKSTKRYVVEKQAPKKNWLVIDTLPETVKEYHDSDVVCHQFYRYRIRSLETGQTWLSFSNTAGDTAFETEAPEPPVIRFASVTLTGSTSGRIQIFWNRSISKDAHKYNLYRSTNGFSWQPVLTNSPALGYEDTGLKTDFTSYYYRIEAIDSCGNLGKASEPHRSILLKAAPGNGEFLLSWNAYQGWTVKQYIIVRDGQPIDTVDGSTTKYTDSLIICRKSYTYEVRAIADITPSEMAASNQSTTSTTNNKKPKRTYLKYVTVSVPNNEVSLAWERSATFDVKWYYVYLRSAVNGRFTLIDSTDKLFYIHKRDTIDQADCYFVSVVDNCGNESDLSNRGCIMVLTGTQQPQEHHLNWTEYSLWPDGVKVYKVYKQEENAGWREIGSAATPEYIDNAVSDTVSNHCYQVEAIENEGTHNATSSSTILCLHQDPVVFVPNIFSPSISKDVNDKFGPKGLYMKTYKMQIYNRWGQLVYDTQDGEQWDGTVNGALAPEGVYLYIITVDGYNKEGGKQRFKGTVTIIR